MTPGGVPRERARDEELTYGEHREREKPVLLTALDIDELGTKFEDKNNVEQ